MVNKQLDKIFHNPVSVCLDNHLIPVFTFQCDRPGWYVGMLADGTTGLYPANHFKPSPVSAQSEA